MMLHGIAADHGPNLAGEIAAHMMLPSCAQERGKLRPAPWIKARKTADPILERALRSWRRASRSRSPAARIARRVGVTSRQLQRPSPGSSRRRRSTITSACASPVPTPLLQQTDLSVTEIAVSAGFNSLEHFCRLYRRQFNCRPRDDRRQSVAAPVLRRRA